MGFSREKSPTSIFFAGRGCPAQSLFVERNSWRQPARRLYSICCCLENVWRLTAWSPKRYIDSVTLPNARDDTLERGRLCVVIATIVINVIAVSLLTYAPWSDWRTGAALNIVDNCLLVGFTIVRRDALMARFLVFGVVVGFTELLADAWLVDYTRTLDYSIGGGPMIWRSPLLMPLPLEVLAVQFRYIRFPLL